MPTSNDDDNHRAADSDTDEEYARRAAEIELALRDPTHANRRWSLLMDTDGDAEN